ncbi:AAA family ATPase [Globicatella sulfidifaciens]|mgnify:CR=1 FL=1|uniref:Nuclease SbcCD subunit C n=1 Tax=Globicatella sulfidifaciens TaxID=136093 RepID=A0A7X8GZW7_9LACT|nr:AAA family ATPase [Globicatella sulfidifaciens]NLJ17876.1 AAA family ATPase [Globicatella sulfidifaciens]
MIEKIRIKEVASYDSTGIEVNLGKINYIYGSNGTGKTTISELLRNSQDQKFSSCSIERKQGSSEFDLFVYNRNFVQENFNIRNEIKGIFTLGKESTDILALIDEKIKDAEKHQERIGNLEKNIEEKEGELRNLQTEFVNQCWNLKQDYDEAFEEAFTGLRGNKKRFMERCLDEATNNNSELFTYEELKNRVGSVFKNSREKIRPIPEIQYDSTLEDQSIFQTKIIGKKDIDIARLISKLNLSDWVQQGHRHMEGTDGICPFCQQELPWSFREKLDEYFDETYTEQIQNLNSSIEKYKRNTIDFFEKYNFLKVEDIPFINKEKISSLLEIIHSTYKENVQLLEMKRNEPSRSIELNSITEHLEQIKSEVEQANIQILELNRVIDNIKEEKERLIKDIWRFIVEENKSNYEYYTSNLSRVNRALDGMNKGKSEQEGFKKKLEEEAIELQNQLTSVLPSIHEINTLLKSFGFTNFQLAESDEQGNYKIVRENGEDANETLSEGEKTFITFLYFYQLINGSNDQDKVNTARVVVIDDPISSLDSNILFMVSNLINNLKKKVRSNDTNFKQLIILTHNVYFHKEISFNKDHGSKKLNDETFWILRKTDNTSQITKYKENPIKNSYELLWKELKENSNSITTPNIMRRILENYFKFFGNIDVNKIIEEFPEEDKVVCNSLLSWANDGSHHVNDDLYIDSNQEQNIIYFEVFRKIFINSNHESHFNMMMGDFLINVEEESAEQEATREIQMALEQAAASQEQLNKE